MSDSPRSILARLEQLKQWQEEQQRALLQKQIAQRELLTQEQRKMYAILGLTDVKTPQQMEAVSDDSEDPSQEYETTNMQRQLTARENYLSSESDGSDTEERKPQVPTRPFLKRGEGLKARFKVDPNVFKLDNLPKYKYANHAKFRAQKKKQTRLEATGNVKERKVDRRSQEKKEDGLPLTVALDINCVQNKKLVPASDHEDNDDVQSISGQTISEESLLPSIESLKLRNTEVVTAAQKESTEVPPIQPNLQWKQQLQEEADILRQLKELKDLDLFELIEQRLLAGDGSHASDASTLLRLLADNSISFSDLLGTTTNSTTLVPAPAIEAEPNDSCLQIRPIPDPKRHFLKEAEFNSESSSDDSDASDEETSCGHVRFAEGEEHEIETDIESQLETVNYSKMSTPKDVRGGKKSSEEKNPQIAGDAESERIREEILAKSEQLKLRLAELESEIENFRRENAELMRMKQEHELEKNKLELDREEMMEKLNDERIKMEVYFHDERLKIEEQRQKALKDAMKPTKKEKEEILRLKEQVAEMQKEMKAKEAKHGSSSARFRSQIKNLEKDLKETQLELDAIKKDNRKLEMENARLKRQNNSRMLLEINKNIAKLTVPQSAEVTRRNSSPEKPRKSIVPVRMKPIDVIEKNVGKVATAKVVSHPRGSTESRKSVLPSGSSSDNESISSECDNSSASEDKSTPSKAQTSRSSYFRGKAKKNLFQTVDDQVKNNSTEEPDRSSETADLIKNLKREIVNNDGSRDIWYPNGNLKKISPDGLVIRMLYFNKDIKETNVSEGTTKYYYFETNTWHTTYLDGLEILEFPDGQTEHRFKDGSTEVHFPNGSIRTTNPNSADIAEEWKYADGSTVIVKRNDDKVITLPNGQVEIHTKAHKRRIYPDGTVKFLYPDGSQESRYSNGRVRLKDKDGNLISDTGGGPN
ncbi:centromere protein J-like [Topomyia yanbarensis]|uniref:centromere protein J-like n=1 Tax=Topomyia yanbarensis TaxID=2498891 RepID=UPI00273A9892|nr:centromere protein J-like [Topomyia yanbarensis]